MGQVSLIEPILQVKGFDNIELPELSEMLEREVDGFANCYRMLNSVDSDLNSDLFKLCASADSYYNNFTSWPEYLNIRNYSKIFEPNPIGCKLALIVAGPGANSKLSATYEGCVKELAISLIKTPELADLKEDLVSFDFNENMVEFLDAELIEYSRAVNSRIYETMPEKEADTVIDSLYEMVTFNYNISYFTKQGKANYPYLAAIAGMSLIDIQLDEYSSQGFNQWSLNLLKEQGFMNEKVNQLIEAHVIFDIKNY